MRSAWGTLLERFLLVTYKMTVMTRISVHDMVKREASGKQTVSETNA